MAGEGEQERKGDQATTRLMEELKELITSPPVPPFDAVGTSSDNLQLRLHRPNIKAAPEPPEPTSETNIYREKLRSYSSFPAITTLSDTTSKCTNSDMIDITMHDQSLSDGDYSDRHLHPQPRHHRGSHTTARNTHTDPGAAPSHRRFYFCDVCGHNFPSPQSLGGHKNVHKSKGRLKHGISSRRCRQAGSGSNSSGSDVASSLYKGVRCREVEKWVTEIRPPKSSDMKWWLGTFPSAEEAAQAYDVALAFFKSASEMNFGHHPLYQNLPPLPPDLSSQEYAQRLREMVREISAQIIAERRLEEQATSSTPLGDASVSPAGSSTSAAAPALPMEDRLPDLPDFATDLSSPASEFEWIRFLNLQ